MAEKKKRRWFQFSLRTLLVFVLVVSVGMSWLGVRLDRARKQREAVEVIEKLEVFEELRGSVAYEELYYDGFGPPDSLVPQWARAVFGEDFFFDVIMVDASFTDLDDEGAASLKRLNDLTCLLLRDTQITDAGLVHLEGLTNLTELFLTGTEITDAGLVHLEGLTNLDYLCLGCTQVTTKGVEHLRRALPDCYIALRPQALPNCSISFESQP